MTISSAVGPFEVGADDLERAAADETADLLDADDDLAGAQRRRRTDILLTGTILIGLVIAWEVAARTYFADRYVLAAPTTIVRQIWTDRDLLIRNGTATIKIALIGYALGNVVAVAIAIVFVLVAPLERLLSQIALAAYSMPTLAVAPILGTMLSRGNTRITVVVLLVFFPTMLAAVSGLRSPTPDTAQLVRSLGGSNLMVLRKVRLRACLPELFAGLRIAVPMALLGAVASEWLGADRGLGIFMVNALGTLKPARVWAICTVCVMITLTGYIAVAAVERRVNRWTGEVRAGTRR